MSGAPHTWYEVIARGSSEVRAVVAKHLFQSGVTALEERGAGEACELVVVAHSFEEAAALADELRAVTLGGQKPRCLVRERRDARWRTRWVEDIGAVVLTERVVVVPDHMPAPDVAPPSRAIVLATELAFGFGEHVTTRLAARAVAVEIERCVVVRAATVLDVGCGTGVLSFVAACHGATECLGVDHDPVAVAVAEKNAAVNQLSSVCRFSADALDDLTESFDVVVANVELPTLCCLAPAMLQRCSIGGAIVVAGFFGTDVPDVLRAFGGAAPLRSLGEGDWVALTLSPSPQRTPALKGAR